MCVGLYTHYAHCDQAYLAVRLVDFLRSAGEPFDIYSDNSPGRLQLPYDRIVKYKGNARFTDWANRRSTIIWTHVPRIEQLDYARRKGITTILAPMWQELLPPFKKAMRRADRVIALSNEARDLYLEVYKLNNVSTIPFDTGLPLTRKDSTVNARRVRLFLPWFDRNARCSSGGFLGMLGFLLERMHEAHLTVAVNSSRFGPAVAKFFTRLGDRTDGRVRLVRSVPFVKRMSLFANADLTVWPGECDNYGLCGLTSLAAGTPVISFGVAPQTDFLHQDVNSALVKTKVDYDDNGVPHARPDYTRFSAALQEMIAEPLHINQMQKKVSYNLLSRKESFESGWRQALNLV
jgi:glycosyltransferase involved in cell wall biosynthesis